MPPRLRDLVEVRVQQPPPTEDLRQSQWQSDVADALNRLPNLSLFSQVTPESNITAQPGTLGFNLASGVSVLWIKQVGSGRTGWATLG